MKRREIKKYVILAINNVILEGCTDVSTFEWPFEISMLKEKEFKKKIAEYITNLLEGIINNGKKFDTLKYSKVENMLVPKKTLYDFRKCALIDIIDEIKYLSFVLIITQDIEKNRLDRQIVYSYRFKSYKNGRIFDKKYTYSAFKNEYKRLSGMKKYKIIIDCDISNFYDRLNIHRLESTLLSISSINKSIVNIINELLLYWANRDSYGLPVGSNASRILAEAFLIEIDNYLLSNNIRFCRFVDDYRFFASDVTDANKILSLFVEILNKNGLSINTTKTGLRDISNYAKSDKKQNENITQENLSEIIRGYSGLVPTKFRKLSSGQIKKLSADDDELLLKKLQKDSILLPQDIILYIKILVAKNKYESFRNIPSILKKYPQFVPYFADVLNKEKINIPAKIYCSVINEFATWLNRENNQEYIMISIVKLFNTANPEEKKIIFNYFKNLKRNSGIYIGRTSLEQLGNNLSRGELIEIKDYYQRADIWEKRQIVKMLLKGLNAGENRPFIKDLKINNNDEFILEMISKYEKTSRRK